MADGKLANGGASKETTCTVNEGFHGTDVVVIEAVKGNKCKFGTGILVQDPKTWGQVDRRN